MSEAQMLIYILFANAAQCWLDAGYHSISTLEDVVHVRVPPTHGGGGCMLGADVRVHGH